MSLLTWFSSCHTWESNLGLLTRMLRPNLLFYSQLFLFSTKLLKKDLKQFLPIKIRHPPTYMAMEKVFHTTVKVIKKSLGGRDNKNKEINKTDQKVEISGSYKETKRELEMAMQTLL